ncbi:hypothetical protein [Nocardia sp. AB354]|uniref:hypothetical protein n=1 Tax=Nocardia sp. AB354 TaxID=3413283 RepID=UPI003C292665
MSNQTFSSWRICSGSTPVWVSNQRTIGGTWSSVSMPAAASTSSTGRIGSRILDIVRTSEARIAAPGVSWVPSRMRTAR